MNPETTIQCASFNSTVKTYWFLTGCIILLSTVLGILLLPVWWLCSGFLTNRWLEAMQCQLTDRSVKLKKGVFIKVEKTVPLEKITDVGLVQGPIMRWLNLEAMSIETAGQSSVGSYIRIVGIEGTREFRDAVLEQRQIHADRMERTSPASADAPTNLEGSKVESTLTEIRDALQRIESILKDPSNRG